MNNQKCLDKRLVLLLVEDTEGNIGNYFHMLCDMGLVRVLGDFKPRSQRDRILQGDHYSGIKLIVFDNYPEASDWIQNASECHMALIDCNLNDGQHVGVKGVDLEVGGIHLWMELLSRDYLDTLSPVKKNVQSIVYSAFSELKKWYEPFCRSDNSSPLQIVIKTESKDDIENKIFEQEFKNELQTVLSQRLKTIQETFLARIDTGILMTWSKANKDELLNSWVSLSGDKWQLRALFPSEAHLYDETKDPSVLEPIRYMIQSVLLDKNQYSLEIYCDRKKVIVKDGRYSWSNPLRTKPQEQRNSQRSYFYTILYAAREMQRALSDQVPEEDAGFFDALDMKDKDGNYYFGRGDSPTKIRKHFDRINKSFKDLRDNPAFDHDLFKSRGWASTEWRLVPQNITIFEDVIDQT